ncbi:hypothetical protein C922_04698 [Plasmodium inui San Antonio 1]|uniref:Phosphatidylinositol glycan, class S n=1 Tax=Plasmodium inui San Antonio 1 TaxID=1237626 RepID=W7A6Y3_9APIC|nr:hypothetical protein C922_04698 [Plasmodium inui San Antonio 1]EUD64854.1 hypothetical protein C922_04698 [Plasmodium inui San Antonio 1]
MNSRTPCVIFYAVSLVVCVVVIFCLNKYERQGVPLEKLRSTSSLVQEVYNATKREKAKGGKQDGSYEKVSHLGIKLFIVSSSGEGSSDSLGTKMKEYFSSQMDLECKDKPAAESISDVQDLFYVKPIIIRGDEIRSDDTGMPANVCLSSSPEKGALHNMLNNSYFICLSDNREEKDDTSVVFTLNRSNNLHVKFSRKEEDPTTHYHQLAEETWKVVKRVFFFKSKNRSLFFNPELDLNFYLASSLYNEGNYKIGKRNTAQGGRDKVGDESRDPHGDDLNRDASYVEGTPSSASSPSFPPVNVATWDFYTEVYYPYLRNFIEQLLNVFQINVYKQTIANIDLFKISEKAKEVGRKRVIILDKVTRFTTLFDDVTFGDILKKPTYNIPKSINLMAVFPSGEEIFFYNPATGKEETTVSFAEWGVVHINNALQRGGIAERKEEEEKPTKEPTKEQPKKQKKEQPKKQKKKYSNVSEEAPLISGFFISHLRQYLGLAPNFSDYIYTIFDADKYDIKYLRSESTDEASSFLYSVRREDRLWFSFFYEIPVRSGIFPFELLALMREAYTCYVVETLRNVEKFVSISNVSIYFRVPMHAMHVFNDILDKVKCSLDLIRGSDGCRDFQFGRSVREILHPHGGGTSGDGHSGEGDNRRVAAARLRERYFRAAVVLAQSAYQDSLQLLSDDTFSIYDILSKDFLLASFLPVLIPYAIPVTFSLFRELFRNIKLAKEKRKLD